jgi:hypothetical protein
MNVPGITLFWDRSSAKPLKRSFDDAGFDYAAMLSLA